MEIKKYLKKYSSIVRWHKLLKGNPLQESIFWNILRETQTDNFDKVILDQFLSDIDNSISGLTDDELCQKNPRNVLYELSKNKYCILGKEIRSGLSSSSICDGIGLCNHLKKLPLLKYEEMELCRVLTFDALVKEFGMASGGGFFNVRRFEKRVKTGKYRFNRKTLRENPVWLTEKKEMEKIVKSSTIRNKATSIRDCLGLVHYQKSELVIIWFPYPYYVRKISKPTINIETQIPFRINLSDKYGKTVDLASAKDREIEVVSCPTDYSSEYVPEYIGKTDPITFNEQKHLKKLKKIL